MSLMVVNTLHAFPTEKQLFLASYFFKRNTNILKMTYWTRYKLSELKTNDS